jgi:two-component system NtrC family response regulator
VGDAVLLAHAFLHQHAQQNRRSGLSLSSEAVRAIETHEWPGNVRELINVVKRAAIMSEGPQVSAADLGLARAPEVPSGMPAGPLPGYPIGASSHVEAGKADGTANPDLVATAHPVDNLAADINLRQVREKAERHAVLTALSRTHNNLQKAAELLGVSRPTLYDLLERLGLKQAR